MNHTQLEKNLSRWLYNTNKGKLDRLTLNKPELRISADMEFNSFLMHVINKSGKIYNYVKSEFEDKPKIIKATTENFIFSFIINSDKTSRIEITLLSKCHTDYDSDFILSRIPVEFGFVYFLKSDFGIKIGCSARLENRLKHFSVKLPFKIELHSFIKCKEYSKIESLLHNLLSHKRINGEWFDLTTEDYSEIDLVLSNMNLVREFDYV